MKSKLIIGITILALGQLMCFGQAGRKDKKPEQILLEWIYNTQQYVVQSDGQLMEVETIADNGLLIQNSYPKGGSYINPKGERFGYGVFWTYMINDTDFPIHIAINFPADSFPIINRAIAGMGNLFNFPTDSLVIFNRPNKYFKLFLPSDKMTLDKIPLFDYGATGVKLFLDTCLNEATAFEKTIQPKETHLFYVGILLHVPDNGPVRTSLISEDNHLFYSVSIGRQLDTVLIPCGRIAVKERN